MKGHQSQAVVDMCQCVFTRRLKLASDLQADGDLRLAELDDIHVPRLLPASPDLQQMRTEIRTIKNEHFSNQTKQKHSLLVFTFPEEKVLQC